MKIKKVQIGLTITGIILYTLYFLTGEVYFKGPANLVFWFWLGSEFTTYFTKGKE